MNPEQQQQIQANLQQALFLLGEQCLTIRGLTIQLQQAQAQIQALSQDDGRDRPPRREDPAREAGQPC